MRQLYNLSIYAFGLGIRIAGLFKEKARKWTLGREHWEDELRSVVKENPDLIWVHCSSLGEFEQGRTVIEALKKRNEKVLLTFFSPSGYENLKNYASAAAVMYLPLDTGRNAKKWLDILQPKAAIFIKYEFWFNFIKQLKQREIPFFLVSGIFRKDHYFFKSYGAWSRRNLKSFTHFFVQDHDSFKLLESIGIKQVTLSGDTRFDRVVQIALSPKDLPEIERFAMDGLLLVAGSTWLEDEKILLPVFPEIPGMKMIIAPHEVSKRRIAELHKMCGSRALLYSNISELTDMHNIIIIDKIGLLSSIYRFGQLAYIGGGFGKGIHNTLEAAVYGKAILFGPNYLKFKEARDMVNLEGAIEIENKNELLRAIQKILKMNRLTSMGDINRKYVIDRKGGTEKIMLKLFELGIIKVN